MSKLKLQTLISSLLFLSIAAGCGNKKEFAAQEMADNKDMTKNNNDIKMGAEIDFTDLKDSLRLGAPSVEFTSSLQTYRSFSVPLNREDLPKMRTVFTMHSGGNEAGMTIPGFGNLKLGKDESNLNVYYIESKPVIQNNDTVVYGCGYSIHYLFKKIKRGIDAAKLPVIAAAVQLDSKRNEVFYSIQSYGMSGINLVKFFKPTINKSFDVEGFGIMQSSIDGIQNIMADSTLSSTVRYRPELIKFIKPFQLEQ